MTGRPRKGTSVRFAPGDGVAPMHARDPVMGLRFNIEARYGGTVEVDLTGVHPRSFAITFAGACAGSPSLEVRSAHAAPSSSICRPT